MFSEWHGLCGVDHLSLFWYRIKNEMKTLIEKLNITPDNKGLYLILYLLYYTKFAIIYAFFRKLSDHYWIGCYIVCSESRFRPSQTCRTRYSADDSKIRIPRNHVWLFCILYLIRSKFGVALSSIAKSVH